jgi:RimJ/RimL family protein N-acetyltransferase
MAGNAPSERVLRKLGMRFIQADENLRYFQIDA